MVFSVNMAYAQVTPITEGSPQLRALFGLDGNPAPRVRYPLDRPRSTLTATGDPRRYETALRTLGRLGLNEDQVLVRLLSSEDVDTVLDPQFEPAFQNLRRLGLTAEQALEATIFRDDLYLRAAPTFLTAVRSLVTAGLSVAQALDAVRTRHHLSFFAHHCFPVMLNNLRRAGLSLRQICDQAPHIRYSFESSETPCDSISYGNERFVSAFQNLRWVGDSSEHALERLSERSGFDRLDNLGSRHFRRAFEILRSLNVSMEHAVQFLSQFDPQYDLPFSNYREAFEVMRGLGYSDTQILSYFSDPRYVPYYIRRAVAHPNFPEAFQNLRSMGVSHAAILDHSFTEELVETRAHVDFQNAVQILRALGLPLENAINEIDSVEQIIVIRTPNYSDAFRRLTQAFERREYIAYFGLVRQRLRTVDDLHTVLHASFDAAWDNLTQLRLPPDELREASDRLFELGRRHRPLLHCVSNPEFVSDYRALRNGRLAITRCLSRGSPRNPNNR